MIPCKDIVKITKEKTALVIPNAVQICTRDEKYYFTSFATRDKTFLVLDRVRKCATEDQVNQTVCHPCFYCFRYDTAALVAPLSNCEGNLIWLLP